MYVVEQAHVERNPWSFVYKSSNLFPEAFQWSNSAYFAWSDFAIRTIMLQWSRVGSLPIQNASCTMFTMVSHRAGLCLQHSML